jgi:hypothetical protein
MAIETEIPEGNMKIINLFLSLKNIKSDFFPLLLDSNKYSYLSIQGGPKLPAGKMSTKCAQ